MEFLQPGTWADALAAKAVYPDAVPIAGGTDVMVELNFDHYRPAALLDLGRIAELNECTVTGGRVRLGAGVTYTRIITELGDTLPALAMASRTVGSPQIRNRGTVGGNLGSASPAGDAHPPLLACDAEFELASTRGVRMVPATEFYTGVKRNVLKPDELVSAVHVDTATGPQQFSKIGTRNAMVIAVCALALTVDPLRQRIGAAIGSAAPSPRNCRDAEEFLAGELTASGQWSSPTPLADSVRSRFAELVVAAAEPIDDVRASASYRRHALRVLAGRTLIWAWQEYCVEGGSTCD